MRLSFKDILIKCLDDPLYFINRFTGLLRGTFYILYYGLFSRNVKIGFPFMVNAKVTIAGPGRVIIGKNCAVFENVFRGLSIATFSRNAAVVIGNGCALGGITIRCYTRVEIGDRTMTAVSLIQDYFIDPDKVVPREGHHIPKPEPIVLGKNVWLGADSLVLGGSMIGNDSVLSAGSCTIGGTYRDYGLIMGNPAHKSLPIDKLLKLKRGI